MFTSPSHHHITAMATVACVSSILLFFAATTATAAATSTPVITKLYPTSGSIAGNTRLTIIGEGFSIEPINNQIYIGNTLIGGNCDVEEYYSTEKKIVCFTPALEGRGTFALNVQTQPGLFAQCEVKSGCFFTYTYDETPIVTKIRPERLEAPGSLNVYGGNFELFDKSPAHTDFAMLFGASRERCNVDSDSFKYNQFTCEAQPIAPGLSAVDLSMGNGKAIAKYPPKKLVVSVVPTIDSISHTQGSVAGGQEVTIKGSGFAVAPSENEVFVHGTPCMPTKASTSEIECVTGAHPDTTNQNVVADFRQKHGESGLILAEHWPAGLGEGSIASELVGRDLYASPAATKLVSRFGSQTDFAKCKDQCATRYTTWFRPNATGDHIFRIKGYGTTELWISTDEHEVPYTADTAPDALIASMPYSRTSYQWSSQTSSPISLSKGKKYWLRAFTKSSSTMSISVRVEMPSAEGDRVNVTDYFGDLMTLLPAANIPVAVSSNGINAVCGKKCISSPPKFDYTAAVTPVISNVEPTTIAVGTVVTFAGTGFTNIKGVSVTIGGGQCRVGSVTATKITCTAVEVVGGTFEPEVLFSDYGRAISNGATVSAPITIDAVTPSTGSKFGSSEIEISGMGFGFVKDHLTVTVCTSKCNIESVVNSKIFCTTSYIATAQACDVTVETDRVGTSAVFGGFTFKKSTNSAATHLAFTQSFVHPTDASVLGNSVLAGFIADPSVVISSAAEVKVALVDLDAPHSVFDCPVLYVFDKKFNCRLPPHAPGRVNVTASINNKQSIVVGEVEFYNEVRGVSTNGLGSKGGNVFTVYYRVWDPKPLSAFEVKVDGAPCARINVKPSERSIACYHNGPAPATTLQKLLLADFTNGATTESFWASGVTRQPNNGGVLLDAGATLMTKKFFNTPVVVKATIRATATYEKNAKDKSAFCIRLRTMTPDATSTRSGYEGYLGSSSGKMGIKIGTWTVKGKTEFDEDEGTGSIGITTTKDMHLRMEIGRREVSFFVDDVLVERFETTSYSSGSVGFHAGCQAIVVRSIAVEDLSPRSLQVFHNGKLLRNAEHDIYHREPTTKVTSLAKTSGSPRDYITMTLSSTTSTWALRSEAFPAGINNKWTANPTPTFCSSFSHIEDSKNYRCRISDSLTGGVYTVRVRSAYGGFLDGATNFTVTPVIGQISPSEITTGTSYVSLTGKGFPVNGDKLTVTVGGKPCVVEHSSSRYARCKLASATKSEAAAVTVSYDGKAGKCETDVTCTVKVGDLAPTVTKVSPTTITHIGQKITITGTDLTRYGSVKIGSSRCSVTYGTSTYMQCTVSGGFSESAGTSSVTVFTENGQASGSLSVTVALGGIGAVSPAEGAPGATIRIASLNAAPSSGMAAATIPTTWDNLPHTRSVMCASPFSSVQGFFGAGDRLKKAVSALPVHTAIGIKATIILADSWYYDIFSVSVDGTVHTFDRKDFKSISYSCGYSNNADDVLEVELVVPHTSATATIELFGTSTFGLASFAVVTGTLPAAPTVGGKACLNPSFRRDEIRCDVPSGIDASSPNAVNFNGKSCGDCTFTVAAAKAPVVENVFVGAAFTSTPTFVSRHGAMIPTASNGLIRVRQAGQKYNYGWSSATATTIQQYTAQQFESVSFSIDENGMEDRCKVMFGLSTKTNSDFGGEYRDLSNAVYFDRGTARVYEDGRSVGYFGSVSADSIFSIACADASCSNIHYLVDGHIFYTSSRAAQFPAVLRADAEYHGCGVKNINVKASANEPAAVPVYIGGTEMDGNKVTVSVNGVSVVARAASNTYVVAAVPSSAVASLPLSVTVTSDLKGTSPVKEITPASFIARIVQPKGSTHGNHRQAIFGGGLQDATISNCASILRTEAAVVCETAAASAGTAQVTGKRRDGADLLCPTARCPIYEYTAENTPTLNPITTFTAGETTILNVSGTNFASGDYPVLVFGDNKCRAVGGSKNTWFQCAMPQKLVAGTFDANARFEEFGSTNTVPITVGVSLSDTTAVAVGTSDSEFVLFGRNFGTDASTESAVELVDANGAKVCSQIQRADGHLICTVGSAVSNPAEPFTLKVGGQSVSISHVNVDPSRNPSITGVAVNSVAGGDLVALKGSNLQNLASVKVGSVDCRLVGKLSTGDYGCRVNGPLAAGSHQLAAVPSSAITKAISISARFGVFGVTPSHAVVTTAEDITIEASAIDTTATYVASVGNEPCIVKSVSATSVTCTVAAAPDETRALTVKLSKSSALTGTGANLFTYEDPTTITVTGISPTSGTAAGGTVVTVSGTNFDHNFQYNIITIGGSRCHAESVNAALTEIICITSPGAVNSAAPVNVSILGKGEATIPTPIAFDYFLSVTAVSSSTSAGPAVSASAEGGVAITLIGTGFIKSEQFFVTVGGVTCPVSSVTATEIVCSLPPAPRPPVAARIFQKGEVLPNLVQNYPARTGGDTSLSVRINNINAAIDSAAKITYDTASIAKVTAVTHGDGMLHNGQSITVAGSGFLSSGNEVILTNVKSKSTSKCQVTSESTTQIVCKVETAKHGSTRVNVLRPGYGFAHAEVGCPAGQFLMCDGRCLADSECVRADWGRSGCSDILEIVSGDTLCHANGGTDKVNVPFVLDNGLPFNLNCPMYGCEGNDCNQTLAIQGRQTRVSTCGSDPNGFFVDITAQFTDFTPVISSTAGGQRITITGSDLTVDNTQIFIREATAASAHGDHATSSSDANLDGSAHVMMAGHQHGGHHHHGGGSMGGTQCKPVEVIGTDGTKLVCVTDATITGNYTLDVRVGGVAAHCMMACANKLLTYSDAWTPIVSAVEKSSSAAVPLAITLKGSGFATLDDTTDGMTVTIGGKPCTITSGTATQLVCKAPLLPAVHGGHHLIVWRDSVGKVYIENHDDVHMVTYDASVSNISPKKVSTAGGTLVTLTGFGFAADATVRFDYCYSETVSSSADKLVVKTTSSCSGSRDARIMQHGKTFTTCNAPNGSDCSVSYSSDVTPSVSKATIDNGALTLEGEFKTSTKNDAEVTFSGVPCAIQSFSASSLTCTVPSDLPAGSHESRLFVTGFGFASGSSATHSVELTLTAFTPSEGSIGGYQSVTISGSGFGSATTATTVTVAGVMCKVTSASPSSLVCQTGRTTTATSGRVAVSLGDASVNSTASYTYKKLATITQIEPDRGSTAGGTMLTISGSGLSKSQTVTIDGVPCTQSTLEKQMTDASSGSKLHCTTGAHATQMDPVDLIIADASGAAAPEGSDANGKYQYVDLWSRRTTWGNNPPPKYMESVVISKGQTVLVDTNPPRLHMVLIFEGHLMFDYTKDITFEATYIFANFGSFTVGTFEKPFYKKAIIRMYGDRLTPEIPNGGAKVIMMRMGKIDIHGLKRQPTWTRLAATSDAGSTTVAVQGPVDWKVGEEIVVGPTDFEQLHAEQRTITAITSDADTKVATITINKPLRWQHFGERQCYGADADDIAACVDEIAEVQLLTRNVVIEGDKDSWKNNIGAQTLMMPMKNDPSTYGRITYTEIRDCGQKFALGRYPVHFHGSGLSNYSFIIGTSVHHSMNRAYTIHGIQNVTYEDNVVYDTFAHSFFVESGNEMYNVLRRNLVMVTRACTSCLNQDLTPANYWITNPANYFYDNVAAGAQFYGFWFALFDRGNHDDHHGDSNHNVPTVVCPRQMSVLAFEGNTGHSNGNYGLNIKPTWNPMDDPFGCNGRHQQQNVLSAFTSYKNQVHGINFAGSGGSITFDGLTVADIGTTDIESSGVWTETANAANQTFGVRNAKFFAFTANQPYHRSGRRRGINMPRSDNWVNFNITFVNFINENWAMEPFRRQKRMSLVYEWGWQYTSRALRFINSPQRVLLRFQHHAILHDIDGTLGGVAGARVVPSTPIFSNYSCASLPNFQSWWPIVRCNPDYTIRRMGLGRIYDSGGDQLWTIDGRSEIVYNLETKTVVTVPINKVAHIAYTSFENPDRWMTRFSPRYMQPQERMVLKSQYREYRWSVNASIDGRQYIRDTAPLVTDESSGSHWDADSRTITALLARPNTEVTFRAYRCPPEGCLGPAAPPPVDKPCEPFGKASTWVSGSVPSGDVIITHEDSVCLDQTTPGWPNMRFSSFKVEGRLHFKNTFCPSEKVTITIERFIHIHGGEMLFGNETHPIADCDVEIIVEEVPLDDLDERTRRNLGPWGSRSIALEMGTLGLHGEKQTVPKANLAATSEAGSTTLVLDREVAWVVGDAIGISATTRALIYTHGADREEQSEQHVIASIAADKKTVTISAPLQFHKLGDAPQNVNGTIVHSGAEVVHLTRKITVSGGHTGEVPHDHGWQLNIGCTPAVHEGCAGPDTDSTTGFPMSSLRPGLVQVEGVTLKDIGQRGRRHGGVEVDGLVGNGETASYFRNNAMWHSMNTGFNLRHTSEPLVVDGNVVYHTFGDSFRVASGGNTITNNVAVMNTIPFGHCSNTYKPDFEACRPGAFRISHSNIVRNNIAASAVGVGFITEGNDCDAVPLWSGNVARSTRDGLLVMDNPADDHFLWPQKSFTCRRVGGLTSFYTADTGVAIWYTIGNVIVNDITIVDTALGVTSIVVDPGVDHGLREPRFHVQNARFKSYFAGASCRSHYYRCRMTKFKTKPWCDVFHGTSSPPLIGNVGILESVFVTQEYTERTPGEKYFMWMEPDSYHTMRGKATFDTIFFDNYDGMDSCERKNLAFYQNFVSNDTVHQHMFSNVQWGTEMKNGGEFWARTTYGYLPNNHHTKDERSIWQDFDNPFYGGFWPDSPNKMWFVDVDGSFTKTGQTTHVLSSQTITRESTWATTGWNGILDTEKVGPVRDGCTQNTQWNAFSCEKKFEFLSFVIHNSGRDRLERRVAPVVLCKGDGMITANGDPICQGGVVDFASGPYMKGKKHKTILQRMSRFRFTVENGGNYTLLYRSTPPESTRFLLTNWEYMGKDAKDVGVVINTRIFGGNSHSRLSVYVNGRKEFPVFGYGYPHEFGLTWPGPFDRPGTHYHDRYIEPLLHRNVMSFTMRPNVVMDLIHENIVQVSMTLSMPMMTFFNQKDTFVAAFVSLMGIPEDSVRFAKIVRGTSRRRAGETTDISLEVDGGQDKALDDTQTDAITDQVQAIDTTELSTKFNGVAISEVKAVAVVTKTPEPVVRIADSTAYIYTNADHPGTAFDHDSLNAKLVEYLRVNGPNAVHKTATESDVFASNVYAISVNTTRMTIQCAFILEEDAAGDNTACSEWLFKEIEEKRFTHDNLTFWNTSFSQNGAPDAVYDANTNTAPTTDSDSSTSNMMIVWIVVPVVVIVVLGVVIAVTLCRKKNSPATSPTSVSPMNKSPKTLNSSKDVSDLSQDQELQKRQSSSGLNDTITPQSPSGVAVFVMPGSPTHTSTNGASSSNLNENSHINDTSIIPGQNNESSKDLNTTNDAEEEEKKNLNNSKNVGDRDNNNSSDNQHNKERRISWEEKVTKFTDVDKDQE